MSPAAGARRAAERAGAAGQGVGSSEGVERAAGAATTSTERRRAADARKAAAGQVQVSVWLDAALLAELRTAWGFGSGREACEVALRYLAARTRGGVRRLDL